MNKIIPMLLTSLIAVAPVAAVHAAPVASDGAQGKMIVDASGARLAPVDRVDSDGSVEVIIDEHVVTIPASTLSEVNGHLTTSMKKNDLLAE